MGRGWLTVGQAGVGVQGEEWHLLRRQRGAQRGEGAAVPLPQLLLQVPDAAQVRLHQRPLPREGGEG